MSLVVSGKATEIVYARLDKNEDLLTGIQKVCRDHGIRTGVVMSITGALERATLQRFPEKEQPGVFIDVVEVAGPLEATGHGIIGESYAPTLGNEPFGVGRYVHGEPYLHIHLVVTSAKETVCGHLMEGCPVLTSRGHAHSHFTVAIASVEGMLLRMVSEGKGKGLYHDLVTI